jgi:hypothetical protein
MGFGGGLPLDCNASGIPDSCEIADGSLNDVDGNGIPDCCEHGTRCKGCPADLNGDGQVGALDLTELLAGWGTPSGDVNGDRTTDATDLTFVLSNWGLCP